MYYKLTNKDSEIYKKLYKLREEEEQIEEDNINAIKEKVGIKYGKFLGTTSQQNFRRVPQYSGFQFLERDNIDLKVWKLDKNYDDIYIPNRRYKLGREMDQFLSNGLKGSKYTKVFEILGFNGVIGRFTFPFVEVVNDIIILYLGDNHIPEYDDVIEITSIEFNEILDKLN